MAVKIRLSIAALFLTDASNKVCMYVYVFPPRDVHGSCI